MEMSLPSECLRCLNLGNMVNMIDGSTALFTKWKTRDCETDQIICDQCVSKSIQYAIVVHHVLFILIVVPSDTNSLWITPRWPKNKIKKDQLFVVTWFLKTKFWKLWKIRFKPLWTLLFGLGIVSRTPTFIMCNNFFGVVYIDTKNFYEVLICTDWRIAR